MLLGAIFGLVLINGIKWESNLELTPSGYNKELGYIYRYPELNNALTILNDVKTEFMITIHVYVKVPYNKQISDNIYMQHDGYKYSGEVNKLNNGGFIEKTDGYDIFYTRYYAIRSQVRKLVNGVFYINVGTKIEGIGIVLSFDYVSEYDELFSNSWAESLKNYHTYLISLIRTNQQETSLQWNITQKNSTSIKGILVHTHDTIHELIDKTDEVLDKLNNDTLYSTIQTTIADHANRTQLVVLERDNMTQTLIVDTANKVKMSVADNANQTQQDIKYHANKLKMYLREHDNQTQISVEEYANKTQTSVAEHADKIKVCVKEHADKVEVSISDHGIITQGSITENANGVKVCISEHTNKTQKTIAEHANKTQTIVAEHANKTQTCIADHANKTQISIAEHAIKIRVSISDHAIVTQGNIAEHGNNVKVCIANYANKTQTSISYYANETQQIIADYANKTQISVVNNANKVRVSISDHAIITQANVIDNANKVKVSVEQHANRTQVTIADHANKTQVTVADHANKTQQSIMDSANKVRVSISDQAIIVQQSVVDNANKVRVSISEHANATGMLIEKKVQLVLNDTDDINNKLDKVQSNITNMVSALNYLASVVFVPPLASWMPIADTYNTNKTVDEIIDTPPYTGPVVFDIDEKYELTGITMHGTLYNRGLTHLGDNVYSICQEEHFSIPYELPIDKFRYIRNIMSSVYGDEGTFSKILDDDSLLISPTNPNIAFIPNTKGERVYIDSYSFANDMQASQCAHTFTVTHTLHGMTYHNTQTLNSADRLMFKVPWQSNFVSIKGLKVNNNDKCNYIQNVQGFRIELIIHPYVQEVNIRVNVPYTNDPAWAMGILYNDQVKDQYKNIQTTPIFYAYNTYLAFKVHIIAGAVCPVIMVGKQSPNKGTIVLLHQNMMHRQASIMAKAKQFKYTESNETSSPFVTTYKLVSGMYTSVM